jgi:hypothetical protein
MRGHGNTASPAILHMTRSNLESIFAWRAPLIGDSGDLEDFPLWLADQEFRIERQGGAFFLILPVAITGPSYKFVREIASQHVELLNGIGRLLSQGYGPISLADSFEALNDVGDPIGLFVTPPPAVATWKVGTPRVMINGVLLPDPRTNAAAPYLIAAAQAPKARGALALLGKASRTWTDLYNLFELVEGEVGDRMFELGWISKTDTKRFSHTANSFSILGLAGRHGKDLGRPPRQPMAHQEAEVLIVALVERWLRYVSSRMTK